MLGDASADARALDLLDVDVVFLGDPADERRGFLAPQLLFRERTCRCRRGPPRRTDAPRQPRTGRPLACPWTARMFPSGPRPRPASRFRLRRPLRRHRRRCAAAGFSPAAPMIATTLLTGTVSPSLTMISVRTPADGDGISASTLSVEISNNGSSRSTESPTFLIHRTIVPSAIDSPICGITTLAINPQNPRATCYVQCYVRRAVRRANTQPAFSRPRSPWSRSAGTRFPGSARTARENPAMPHA